MDRKSLIGAQSDPVCFRVGWARKYLPEMKEDLVKIKNLKLGEVKINFKKNIFKILKKAQGLKMIYFQNIGD